MSADLGRALTDLAHGASRASSGPHLETVRRRMRHRRRVRGVMAGGAGVAVVGLVTVVATALPGPAPLPPEPIASPDEHPSGWLAAHADEPFVCGEPLPPIVRPADPELLLSPADAGSADVVVTEEGEWTSLTAELRNLGDEHLDASVTVGGGARPPSAVLVHDGVVVGALSPRVVSFDANRPARYQLAAGRTLTHEVGGHPSSCSADEAEAVVPGPALPPGDYELYLVLRLHEPLPPAAGDSRPEDSDGYGGLGIVDGQAWPATMITVVGGPVPLTIVPVHDRDSDD